MSENRPTRLLLALAMGAAMLVVPLLTSSENAAAAERNSFDVGGEATCAVMSDSTVECWGRDHKGHLGTLPSTEEARSTPTTVPGVIGARSVSVGQDHVCVVLSDATVTCWGGNDDRQLGDPAKPTDPQLPTSVPGLVGVIEVTTGFGHTCALLSTGTVACWGANDEGQSGSDPALHPITTPTAVAGLTDVVQIEAGSNHTCARTSVGAVNCWGANDDGQLGDGTTTTESHAPVAAAVSGSTVDVSAGHAHTCAVLSIGTIECWGEGGHGQLGDGNEDSESTPAAVTGLNDAQDVEAGDETTCAIRADRTALCWGGGSEGQLGNSDIELDQSTTPVPVAGLTAIDAIAGDDHFCASTSTDSLACWGDGDSGQLGVDLPDEFLRAHQTTTQTAGQVDVGRLHTCLRGNGGLVACLGRNDSGQLGNSTFVRSFDLVPVTGLTTANDIGIGDDHSCAALVDATAVCWGSGTHGRLGNNSQSNQNAPVVVDSLTGVTMIDSGNAHSCAVTTSQEVWCWGLGLSGQIGNGTDNISNTVPSKVSMIGDAVAVSTGDDFSCAIVALGAVKCWGENGNRQLGDGTTTDSNNPVATNTITNATQISSGADHSCVRTSAGEVWCWGDSGFGRLGVTGFTTVPVQVPGVVDAVQVAAGSASTCILHTDETVTCFGRNLNGVLGDGTTTNSTTPVKVIETSGDVLTGIRSISADQHACAARKAAAGGGTFCWGSNALGQVAPQPWLTTPAPVALSLTVGATTTTSTSSSTTSTTTTSTTSTTTSTSTTSTTSPTTVPTSPNSDLFVAVAPSRLVDSRSSTGAMTVDGDQLGGGRLAAGGSFTVKVAGRANVPSDASAAVVNITAIRPGGVGFMTAHPCLDPAPTTSSLNYSPGVSLGNEVIVELDTGGNACIFTSAVADLAVDVVAYLPAGASYTPVGPARLADTRPAPAGTTVDDKFAGDGRIAAAGTYPIDIVGRAGIPINATAAVLNLTAIRASGVGYFTVHPCLPTPPNAASLNYTAGSNRGNEIIAPLSSNGQVCVFSSASSDLALDVVGYVSDTSYSPVSPARLLETRNGPGLTTADGKFSGTGKRGAAASLTVDIAGRSGVPVGAKTVTINITAIAAEAIGYTTVHPCLPTAPNAASLNFVPGVNGGNEIIAELNSQGQICIFTSAPTHLTIDIAGYTT